MLNDAATGLKLLLLTAFFVYIISNCGTPVIGVFVSNDLNNIAISGGARLAGQGSQK